MLHAKTHLFLSILCIPMMYPTKDRMCNGSNPNLGPGCVLLREIARLRRPHWRARQR